MRGGIRRLTSLFALLAGVAPLSGILATVCRENARAITICAGPICPGPPPPASDVLAIVDDAGKIVSDINGEPAIATISEEAEDATGSASVSIKLRTIGLLPPAPSGFIALEDPVTKILSDVLTFTGNAAFALCSVSDAAHAAACVPLVDGIPVVLPPGIPETGQPQVVMSFPSPSGSGEYHVIVRSSEPVPEPSTALLLLTGLGWMSVVRERRGRRAG
jgi:hypothetical protein